MFPNASALSKYKAVQVTTCSPGQLLLMLYDGLFRFIREAQDAIDAKNPAVAGERISRSHAILEHLLTGLDPTAAPELCAQLEPLYVYCMRTLIEANIRRDPQKLADVIRVLTPLREAWGTVVAQSALPQAQAAR
jgi:flagellar protein FliS